MYRDYLAKLSQTNRGPSSEPMGSKPSKSKSAESATQDKKDSKDKKDSQDEKEPQDNRESQDKRKLQDKKETQDRKDAPNEQTKKTQKIAIPPVLVPSVNTKYFKDQELAARIQEELDKAKEMLKMLDETAAMLQPSVDKDGGRGQEQKTRIQEDLRGARDFLNRLDESAARLQPMDAQQDARADVSPILMGDMTYTCPPMARIVRIFTSSTFTDTANERNMLMEEAYPLLKKMCHNLGYDFQVVDMRWGIRDEAADDHSTTDLCLKELQFCKELSTGPYFITLLSHKYGYRSLIKTVEANEFELILDGVSSHNMKALLLKWYKKDMNAVPPVYQLSKISDNIPEYLSSDKDKKKTAKDQWWQESNTMYTAMETAAFMKLESNEARKYIISVTEKEIQKGILENSCAETTAFWFRRHIVDIEKQEPSYLLSRYTECLGEEHQLQKSKALLRTLEDESIPKYLPKTNIKEYTIKWSDKGVTKENRHHLDYLKTMTDDFVKEMLRMIEKGIRERDEKTEALDDLHQECVNHLRFCQEKNKNFHGRDKVISEIKSHLTGKDRDPFAKGHGPIVIHGESGCGKTSIMAALAKSIPEWFKPKNPAVVIRFIGTTPDSSNVEDMLFSVIQQINIIYGLQMNISKDMKTLRDDFYTVLKHAKGWKPLIILLDSLDQLSESFFGRELLWLPKTLPAHVYLVVSTLENEKYICFPKLKAFCESKNFIPVPPLELEDAQAILKNWFSCADRHISDEQNQIVMKAFKECPIPLFLKMAFDQAKKWCSYFSMDETRLQTTILTAINYMFSELEVHHGQIFVARALGYLTLSKSGLSETELEDILSCDDDVLNDVYQYWTPPIRRLPPLLLVRLRTDIQEYLVNRGAENTQVMYWYHRQFIEAARQRYCKFSIEEELHRALADFFAGKWASGTKKEFKDKSGNILSADRHVSAQPLQFDKMFNKRKLNNQPFHRIFSGNIDLAKEEVLCNFEFLDAKIKCSSIRAVIEDMNLAQEKFPEDKVFKSLLKTLQLSQDALIYDENQLAAQLLPRLAKENDPNLQNLRKTCLEKDEIRLESDVSLLRKPNDQLVHILTEHGAEIESMDISACGKMIVTCAYDTEHSVKLWDTEKGKLVRSFDNLGEQPSFVKFVDQDTKIFIEYSGSKKFLCLKLNGEVASLIKKTKDFSVGFLGKGITHAVLFISTFAFVYDLVNGKLVKHVAHKDRSKKTIANSLAQIASSSKHILIPDFHQKFVTRLSAPDFEFSEWSQLYKIINDDDESDEDDFTIEALAITPDETKFVHSNIFDNNLHICNLQTFELLQTLQGNPDHLVTNLVFTQCGKHLMYANDMNVTKVDINTGERKDICFHSSSLKMALSNDGCLIFTICGDSSLRVWNMSLNDTEAIQDKKQKKSSSMLTPLENPRYVTFVTRYDRSIEKYFLHVYDIITKEIIRSCEVMEQMPTKLIAVKDKNILVVTKNKKLKVVDLNTMKLAYTFHGTLNSYMKNYVLTSDKKFIITTTKGNRKLKMFDVASGKTVKLFTPPEKYTLKYKRLSGHLYSDGMQWLATDMDNNGPLLLFNILTGEFVHVLFEKENPYIGSVVFSSSGDYVAIITTGNFKDINNEIFSKDCCLILQTKTGKEIAWSYDREKAKQLSKIRSYYTMVTFDVHNLTAEKFVTTHDHNFALVWQWQTGLLLQRLGPFRDNFDIRVFPDSKYFLVEANIITDNTLTVYDTESCQKIASFRPDEEVKGCIPLSKNFGFITNTKEHQVVFLHLTCKGKIIEDIPDKDFEKSEIIETLQLSEDTDLTNTPSDLDDDVDDSDGDDNDTIDEDDDDDDDD